MKSLNNRLFFKSKKFILSIVLFSIMLITALLGFLNASKEIRKIVSESSYNFLEQTALLYARTFQIKIQDQLAMLESQSRYFNNIDMNDYNAVKQTIMSTKGVGEIKSIAVANSSGMTINYDGKSSENILTKDYFQKAIKGIPQVSSNFSLDENGEKVLTLAVPIYQGSNIVGVITGTVSYSILDDIFSVETFKGYGYTTLSDQTGTILVQSKSQKSLCKQDNWIDFFSENKALSIFELSRIYYDIQKNRSGSFEFSIGDEKRITFYNPVGLNNWYILSTVTADFILSEQSKISSITMFQILLMLGVFLIVIIIISVLFLQKLKVEKENSRYAVTSENNKTIVFEFDLEKKVIEFTGNTDYILGENLKELPISQFERISSKIHETENNLIDIIRNSIKNGQTSFTSEFRLQGIDKEYAWHRLNLSITYNENTHKPVKLIGNLVNVNTQIIHEQELQQMAMTDLLSGLLNKISFEKNVSNFINQKGNSSICAMFIIDLDNFKQVNDKLGHTFGDQAICDTANKITLVFSEKDFIGRIGGDEFCVFLCLKDTVKDALSIIEQKANTMREILVEYYTNGKDSVAITPSIGISLYPEQANNFKDLFKKADAALYTVKNSGKNNYLFYNSEMKNKGESVYE